MTEDRRHLRLGLVFFGTGAHIAAWRHPNAQADGHVNLRHYLDTAGLAEKGLFDFLFVADAAGVRGGENLEKVKRTHFVTGFEPLTLLSAVAAHTSHIGLVATISTSLIPAYQVARQFASLDLLSGGRAALNLVTSTQELEAQNFGLDHLYLHAERYRRAHEYTDILFGLWDSWDQDAFVRDKASGLFFDPTKGHVLGYRGEYYSVRGPLNVPRSPQGRPVIVQAGSSDDGKGFAARVSDVIFTAQPAIEGAKAFYADVKGRAAAWGRDPDQLIVMPGMQPILGETEAEARKKADAINALIHIDTAVAQLSVIMGDFDLSPYPLDGPLPYDDIPETNGLKSRQEMLLERARRENLTIRQLAMIAAQSSGHGVVVGTPRQVADRMELWLEERACDGFNLNAAVLPRYLEDIVEHLIPELQRRGLFRTEYEGKTLRENLGLPVPASRYAQS